MKYIHRPRRMLAAPSSQRGAALYIALILLLLMSMIGIIGMQVSGMQEKMSANYRNVNLAFQNAEADARLRECFLEGMVNRTGACAPAAAPIEEICDNGFDPTNWARSMAMSSPVADRVSLRSIGGCIPGNSGIAQGVQPVSEDPNPVYQISIYATTAVATADAAIDTIFRP